MTDIRRALRLPLTSATRSAIGIALLLIPFLNIIGFVIALGYGSRLINKKPVQLLAWQPNDFVKGILFFIAALLLAAPALIAYLFIARALDVTSGLLIGVFLATVYTYVLGSAYISYSQEYRFTHAFAYSTWARLTHADYFISWLCTLVINAIALATLTIMQRAIEVTSTSATASTIIGLALLLIFNATIGWAQLSISAGIYSGVTP